jgi:hypothetical protein
MRFGKQLFLADILPAAVYSGPPLPKNRPEPKKADAPKPADAPKTPGSYALDLTMDLTAKKRSQKGPVNARMNGSGIESTGIERITSLRWIKKVRLWFLIIMAKNALTTLTPAVIKTLLFHEDERAVSSTRQST